MRRLVLVLGLAACGDLKGISGTAPPLATMQVQVSDPGVAGEQLRVALVWGEQWLPEALCTGLVPATAPDEAAVLAAGCRDPFGFVPLRVAANVAVTPGEPATIELVDLPASDVLVGDVTARVAYGSFVLYDDRDGTGNLELARANRIAGGPGSGDGSDAGSGSDAGDDFGTTIHDVVHGASFVTMTAPDQRLAYREGAFVASAFYPRAGCADPPPAFSIVGAGGFTPSAAIAATIAGQLPPEDPAACSEAAVTATVVPIPLADPTTAIELACTENTADSSVRYREPMTSAPDLSARTTACVPLPTLDGTTSPTLELIVTGRTDDSCKGLTHYILKGCRTDASCEAPDWDHSLAPPTWWPCPAG